jgi:hypothetical protein
VKEYEKQKQIIQVKELYETEKSTIVEILATLKSKTSLSASKCCISIVKPTTVGP